MLSFDIDLGDLEASAKVDGHGQAKILTDEELTRLFEDGFQTFRDRALFAICMFTGCRISEALQLKVEMIRGNFITFTRETRKGKTGTQQVEIVPALQSLLDAWSHSGEMPQTGYLFKGRRGSKQGFMSRMQAHEILKAACDRVGLEGVSTHSFRRTYITKLRDKGYSPAQIQKRTGHKRRENLMHYFDQV
ncbi:MULTISPECIES: tyrosine-type recombinase/integrase [Leptolyngbya]|uniref:tyrosine-type recombinase/integrase n=1 Tax=Leptolyngbya TaxID=47251 RepID=UPI001683D505|nr:site-specific integrase [Leptolyngbya sp. FACHB-1624]MBD1858591.1 site-specific integrase [Leptolyngbya sp. FACHB-1624]